MFCLWKIFLNETSYKGSHHDSHDVGKELDLQYVNLRILNTVDSRYLEIEGTLKNSSRYPYFDISDL